MYHILNGSSLQSQFPTEIGGQLIVAKECLVDGPVDGETLEQLFATRAQFIHSAYEGYTDSKKNYYQTAVPEFEKILAISTDSDVHLWFEDDLFCQVNLWFVLHLMQSLPKHGDVYLVRPTSTLEYGFGGMDKEELKQAFINRKKVSVSALQKLSQLWRLYQQEDLDQMQQIAQEMEAEFPFLIEAIQAHIDRIPSQDSLGRPKESIRQIAQELQTDNFGLIFQAFCKRESIYGFGDLQVKKLVDEVFLP